MEDVNIEEGRTLRGRKCNLWIVLGFFYIAIAVGAGVVLALYLVPYFTKEQYGLVFDAGSSHSDVTLFRWPGAKLRGTGEVIEVTRCEAEGGGISSYKENPPQSAESLRECLSAAQKKVPKDLLTVTPVYLGATAGMRLLSDKEATPIFNAIADLFAQTGLKYEDGYARIISDQEEASFAWITANLLLRQLGQTGERVETTGTLDLGGASTQIAFETSERAKNANESDYQSLRLYGYDFDIFAHSYLCWGTDQAALRYRSILVLKNNAKVTEIDDPCFNKGFEEEIQADNLFNQKCTTAMPNYYKGSDIIKFKGQGNGAACRKFIEEQIDVAACKEMFREYCLDTSVIPPIKGKFMAISSFYYVASFLKIDNTTLQNYLAESDRHCNRTFDEVKEMKGQSPKYSKSFCYNVQYQRTLLQKVYGFDTEEKFKGVSFLRNIDGVTTGWALGFMANATNAIPTEKITAINPNVFVILFIIFIVILLVLSVLGFRMWQRKRRTSSTISSAPREATCLGLFCPRK